MRYLHLCTGLYSFLSDIAAHDYSPDDEHAVLLMFQQDPAEVSTFRTCASNLLSGTPVIEISADDYPTVTLANPALLDGVMEAPDVIVSFHSHSVWLSDALLRAFPNALLDLVDEGTASYAPALVSRHRDPSRIRSVFLHEYLGIFEGFEPDIPNIPVKRIEADRFRQVLRSANTALGVSTGTPVQETKAERPVIWLCEQYLFLKGNGVTIDDEAQDYADHITELIELGYDIAYRRHPREQTDLFDRVMARLSEEHRSHFREQERAAPLLEMELEAGFRPTAIAGLTSTTMLTAPHFFDLPSVRFDSLLPLRMASGIKIERTALANLWILFRSTIPSSSSLRDIHSEPSERPALAFAEASRRFTEQQPLIKLALGGTPIVTKRYIDILIDIASDRFDWITFDAFETLIDRDALNPSDIFAMCDHDAATLLPPAVRFSNLRAGVFQRMRASADRRLALRPEYTLDDVYRYLSTTLGIPANAALELKRLELQVELEHTHPRAYGLLLMSWAILTGKHVGVISDTYFTAEQFRRLVLDRLPAAPDFVLISSAAQQTKRDGGLFQLAITQNHLSPARTLHIGDNPESDEQSAAAQGLASLRIPRTSEAFLTDTMLGRVLKPLRTEKSFSYFYSLVARRFCDNPHIYVMGKAIARLDPFFLGYALLGPALVSWVLWIARQANIRGYDRLLFLARDGWIPKHIYDLISRHLPGPPESVYASASRAIAIGVFRADAAHISYNEFVHGYGANASAAHLIRVRFGEEALATLTPFFPEYNLSTKENTPLGKNLPRFKALLTEHAQDIADSSQRDLARQYYNNCFADAKNPAVVDFGYSGSSQRAVVASTSRPVGGLYFTRMEHNVEYADILDLNADAFTDDTHFFKNGGFLEFLFTPARLGSALGFQRDADGSIRPRTTDGSKHSFTERIQDGILAFSHDLEETFGDRLAHFPMRSTIAIHGLRHFLARPRADDVRLVLGEHHEDSIGADRASTLAYWTQGMKFYRDHPDQFESDTTAPTKRSSKSSLNSPHRILKRAVSRVRRLLSS